LKIELCGGDYIGIQELTDCLRAMVSIQDPLSMSDEERREQHVVREVYSSATDEEMSIVYNKLSKEINDTLQSDLLDFLADVWRYNRAYRASGELWEIFGYNGESQMVTINVEDRHNDHLKFQRYTKSQLVDLSSDHNNPTKELSKLRLSMLNKLPSGAMAILFYDSKKERLHGFPFDISFYDIYPENNPKRKKDKPFLRKSSRDFTLDD